MATLDLAGIITRVCTDLKLRFAAIIHNHSASDITSGTLPIDRGGTGATSAANARTNLGISGTWYGTSSTTASTAAKASTIDNFRLMKGAVVSVTFSTANTVNGALTLNINSTGAKTIYVNNAATSASNNLLWNAGETLTFVYSGSYWYLISRFLVESDFVKLIDKNIVLPNTNISIADAYNQDTYGGYGSVIFTDAYNNQIGYAQTIQIADPNDGMSSKIAVQIGGNNHTEDDYNTLALGFDSDDNPWISLSYPAAFRKALGFGDGAWETQYDTGPTVSVANSSWVKLTHITLSAGHWLVLVGGYAQSNNTGRRGFHLSSAESVTTGRLLTKIFAPPPGGTLYTIIPYLVNPTANTTYNIFGWQNSGDNLNMSAVVRAIHIYTA